MISKLNQKTTSGWGQWTRDNTLFSLKSTQNTTTKRGKGKQANILLSLKFNEMCEVKE